VGSRVCFLFCFVVFLQCWGLNWGPCVCQIDVTLNYPVANMFIWKMKNLSHMSCEMIYIWVYLVLRCSF
jgi:hypothetical protein